MLQDVPLHVVMLTFGAVAYDRCRYHANPTASPVSPSVVSCCLWIVSWLIVLPYPVYTTYLDLGVSTVTARASASPNARRP